MDDQGHGTHCAGIAAGNGILKGVAPDAKLYALKALNDRGSGYTDDLIAAINFSADPDGDGDLSDTDFFLSTPDAVPGVWYPYDPPYNGVIKIANSDVDNDPNVLNEARFDEIPGLGRALKFTFTLYDSKGVIKEGRTFTHIVYLGD